MRGRQHSVVIAGDLDDRDRRRRPRAPAKRGVRAVLGRLIDGAEECERAGRALRHVMTLRRAGTQYAANMGPGSAAHQCVLRCVLDTISLPGG